MSEQQGDRGDYEPSAWRQSKLRGAYEANVAHGRPPFYGLLIESRAELLWLLREFLPGPQIDLSFSDLHGADLRGINLEYAVLHQANLTKTNLSTANLHGADFRAAALSDTDFTGADLRDAQLSETLLDRSLLRGADLTGAFLVRARLVEVDIGEADLDGKGLVRTKLGRACLQGADLTRSNLREVDLSGADLRLAQLTGAILAQAILTGADLRQSILYEADLRGARMDAQTRLDGIDFTSGTLFADVVWNGTPLSNVTWVRELNIFAVTLRRPRLLGDELVVKLAKGRANRASAQRAAARANSGLATAMRSQGLIDDSDLFAYHAKVLQRRAQRYQFRLPQALGSWFLDLISGYGYKPMRSLITYVLVVGAFALTYYLLGTNVNPPLDPLSAVVFSITSFHGRGFAPGENVLLNNPLTVIAAGEAIIGLLIEITFIATFTQRFFAR